MNGRKFLVPAAAILAAAVLRDLHPESILLLQSLRAMLSVM